MATLAADLQATIRALVEGIGPRGSASVAEQRAADFVAERMRALGMQVTTETFRSVQSFSLPYGTAIALSLLGLLLYPLLAPAGVALALLGPVIFALEAMGVPVLSRLLANGESRNVIGIIPAASLASGSKPERRLIVT